MAQNACNGESHTGTVAESVADEDFRWELVALEEGQSAQEERNDDGQREHVLVCGVRIAVVAEEDLDDVVDHYEEANNEGLADFDAIDACVNVDSICAENGNIAHVEVVKWAQIDEIAKNWSQ